MRVLLALAVVCVSLALYKVLVAPLGPSMHPPPVARWAKEPAAARRAHWALVTGGSRGIGYGMAKRLRSRGFNVAVTSMSDGGLAKALERLAQEPCPAAKSSCEVGGFVADVTKPAALAEDAEKLFREKDVRVLVLNAALTQFSAATVVSQDYLTNIIAANIETPARLVAVAVKAWRPEGKHGVILGHSTIASFANINGGEFYTSTRSFQSSLFSRIGGTFLDQSSSLSDESTQNILLATVEVSIVRTHMYNTSMKKLDAAGWDSSVFAALSYGVEEFADIVLEQVLDEGRTFCLPGKVWRFARFLSGMGLPIGFGDSLDSLENLESTDL